jgi:hypothetical protein
MATPVSHARTIREPVLGSQDFDNMNIKIVMTSDVTSRYPGCNTRGILVSSIAVHPY